tara:strand:+ start:432 stop:692 length:261 start_codon:yes stop_codon:yes gene_type:complete
MKVPVPECLKKVKTQNSVTSICAKFTEDLEALQETQLELREAAHKREVAAKVKVDAAIFDAANAQEEANSAQVAIDNIRKLFGKRV